MSQHIESTLRIMAPREEVWSLLHNPARRAEWDVDVRDVAALTPLAQRRGSRTRLTFQGVLGRHPWWEIETLAWSPPERMAFQAIRFNRGTLLHSVGGSSHLHDNGDGTTNWTLVLNIAARGGIFAGLVERLHSRGVYTRRTVQSQQNLKRLIEAEYVQPPAPAPARPPLLVGRW